MGDDIQIISLTKKELSVAISNNEYWSSKTRHIPFSKNKAQWLLKNERIRDEDICAVIGTEKQEVISFIFFVPDYINTKNGQEKVFWSRRWWISDKYKNSILPTYTMNTAMNAVKNKIVIKFLGKAVVDYYKKQPFTEFAHRTRYFIIFNLDANLITSKVSFLKHFKLILKNVDSLSLRIASTINLKNVKNQTKTLKYDYISVINESLWRFIAPFCENDLVPKTKEYVSHQIDNNQNTNTIISSKYQHKCLVSSSYHCISNISFAVIKDDNVIGFISFLVRNKEAMVRYFICKNENFSDCANALIENVIRCKVSSIQTENEVLGKYIQKTCINTHTNKRELCALAHNDLEIDFDKALIFDRDGNFA